MPGFHSDGETWKNGRVFSGNFDKTGKFSQNTGKIRKHYTGKLKKYWKSQRNLSVSSSENPANMVPYFRLKKELKKILENCEKYGKSQEIYQFEKVGTMIWKRRVQGRTIDCHQHSRWIYIDVYWARF